MSIHFASSIDFYQWPFHSIKEMHLILSCGELSTILSKIRVDLSEAKKESLSAKGQCIDMS